MRPIVLTAIVLAAGLGGINPTSAADLIGKCAMSGRKGDPATLNAPAVAGQLTVAVALPAPVWWNGSTPEAVKDGFEYCLAANIAWRAGYDKLGVVDVPWDRLIHGEATGFDLALSEIAITEERKKALAFSVPYLQSDFGVLIKPGTAVDETTIKGLRLGVQDGTAAAAFAESALKAPSVKVFAEPGELYTAVRSGQIDAALTDAATALAEQGLEAGSLVMVGRYHGSTALAAVYPKGSVNGPALDKIIAGLLADGTQTALAKTYLWSVWGLDPESVGYFSP